MYSAPSYITIFQNIGGVPPKRGGEEASAQLESTLHRSLYVLKADGRLDHPISRLQVEMQVVFDIAHAA